MRRAICEWFCWSWMDDAAHGENNCLHLLLFLIIYMTQAEHDLLTNTSWKWRIWKVHIILYDSLLLHWTRCHDLGSNLWGKKVFSRKFYLGWTVLWGWDSGVIHNSFDEWGTVMGLCKMFITPHGSHMALQHLQCHFYWTCVWRVAQEWWGESRKGFRASLLASVLPLLQPSSIVHYCVSCPLSCHCLLCG